MKKWIACLLTLGFLTACGAKKPPVDFGSPAGGPDLSKLRPPYGPNDPVPGSNEPAAPVN